MWKRRPADSQRLHRREHIPAARLTGGLGHIEFPGENADSGDSIGKMVQSDDTFAESARLRRLGSQVTGNT